MSLVLLTVLRRLSNVGVTRLPPENSENKPLGLYFSKALFEGLIFGGAYVRRGICISKSIGLACSGKEIYHFCFVLLCIREQIPCTSPPGRAYIRRSDLTEVFFALRFRREGGAYIWRGLFSEFYGILLWTDCVKTLKLTAVNLL